jgi:hypothetical protein
VPSFVHVEPSKRGVDPVPVHGVIQVCSAVTPFSHDVDRFVVLYGSVMATLYWGFVMSSRDHSWCSLMC